MHNLASCKLPMHIFICHCPHGYNAWPAGCCGQLWVWHMVCGQTCESLIVRLYSEIDQIHLSSEAQCASHHLPPVDCHKYKYYVFCHYCGLLLGIWWVADILSHDTNIEHECWTRMNKFTLLGFCAMLHSVLGLEFQTTLLWFKSRIAIFPSWVNG